MLCGMAVTMTGSVPEWTLGDRLTKARKIAGLDQSQMAERHGVTHSTVSAWENDVSQPRHLIEAITRYAEISGLSFVWLLTGEGLEGDGGDKGPRGPRRRRYAPWDSNPEPADYAPRPLSVAA